MSKTLLDWTSDVFSYMLMTKPMRIVVPREKLKTSVGKASSEKGSVRCLLRPLSSCTSCSTPAPRPPITVPPASPAPVPVRCSFWDVTGQRRAQRVCYTSTYFYLLELFLSTNLSPSHPVFFLRVTFLLSTEPDLQRPAGSL